MASSGRMSGSSYSIGGYSPQYYFIDWQLASQDINNNTSTINWQAYFHYTLADAQLDNGEATLGGAQRWYNGGRVKNYTGNFTTRDHFITSGTFTVGHNADGTYTLGVSGGIDIFSTGRSSGSASWSLPTIPRYANITSASATAINDVGFTINFTVDATIDRYAYSLDNGSTWSAWVNGDTTGVSVAVGGNLASETTYNWKVKYRRKDSQLESVSGTYSTTTAGQNNFLGFM